MSAPNGSQSHHSTTVENDNQPLHGMRPTILLVTLTTSITITSTTVHSFEIKIKKSTHIYRGRGR